MAPAYIDSMQPFKFHDQTSNQLWVDVELGADYNEEILRKTANELHGDPGGWLKVYTRAV
jgi:transaldolase